MQGESGCSSSLVFMDCWGSSRAALSPSWALPFPGRNLEKTAGVVTAAAGILTLASALIPGLRILMLIPGIGLLGAGIWSVVKFFRGLKSRS